jgi:hypothetical protein
VSSADSPIAAADVSADTRSRLAQLQQAAITALEKAQATQPAQTTHVVDLAEVELVRLRDALIELQRSSETPIQARRWRPTLDQVNAVLSLVVGIEYPAAGVQEKTIKEALRALKAIQI